MTRSESAQSDEWLAEVPREFEILIWHHDAFTLPPGASPLYSSAYCPDQAFVLGNTLALQCHVQLTAPMVGVWADLYAQEITEPDATIQSKWEMTEQLDTRIEAAQQIADMLYTRWLQSVIQA